ncbi:MAG TPA: UDP-glucose 4-epimerase [Opitutae bacterium]|nr:UDP-glucose 4-epimerase [Opitutaceae bacterium]HCR28972.1 UDP-glucose 4-epimerase [Opitutae bacterium]|tara:strand:+ start:371 stop:1375 length:1005 start_codon:yes stop_codon:yes gene_type:complete
MSETALVTGAAGFIGSHVAEHCLKLGIDVVATDNLSGGSLDNVPAGCEFVEGDLKSNSFVESLWNRQKFDYVYHLGAYAAEGLSHFIRAYNYRTNLLASVNLLNQAVNHEVKCFVFTSSIAVYGANQLPMDESMTPLPEDPYGISKYAFELDLRAAHQMFGLNYIIFRPHNVYGPRQNIADKYRNVIGIFMNQLLKGEPMTIFGDGKQTRAFSYIDDVAPLIARSPRNSKAYQETFNIGADTPHSVLELAHEVSAAMGKPTDVRHLEARNEVVDAYAKHDKIREVFDCPVPVSLKAGIREMARWVQNRPPSTPEEFCEIEIAKSMPESWKNVIG